MPFLLVESGDFLFKGKPLTPGDTTAAMARADLILRAYHLMRYDAVLPGESDFSGGISLLLDHEKRGVPFTCLNLVHASSGKPVFPPFRKMTRGGAKILVVGLIGEGLFPKGALAGFGWRILPPQEALSRLLESKETEADIFIVLTHLEDKEELSLARGSKQPLLIFAAHNRTPLPSPVSESGSLIFRPAEKGTHLVEALIGRDGNHGRNSRIGFVDARILEQNRKKRRALTDEMKGMDARSRGIYEKALGSFDNAIREAEGKRKVHFRMIPLDRDIADDPRIKSMLDEHEKRAASMVRTLEKSPATMGDYR